MTHIYHDPKIPESPEWEMVQVCLEAFEVELRPRSPDEGLCYGPLTFGRAIYANAEGPFEMSWEGLGLMATGRTMAGVYKVGDLFVAQIAGFYGGGPFPDTRRPDAIRRPRRSRPARQETRRS